MSIRRAAAVRKQFPTVILGVTLLALATAADAQMNSTHALLSSPVADTAAATATDADQILTQAKAQAAAEHKNVLLVFSASWCGPCRMFESFLRDPATAPIMQKNFVIARFDVGERPGDKRHSNTPGAEELRSSLHGAEAGYPFLVVLDPAGKIIVDSYRPVPGHANSGDNNIGYPATPAEIDWFMKMLHISAPSISSAEENVIRKWLQQRSTS